VRRIGSRAPAGLDGEARLLHAREQPRRVEPRLGLQPGEEVRAVLRAPQRLRSDRDHHRGSSGASGCGELAHDAPGQLGPRRVEPAGGEDTASEPRDARPLEDDPISALQDQQQHRVRAEIDHAHARRE
jgi:hypothetical protein